MDWSEFVARPNASDPEWLTGDFKASMADDEVLRNGLTNPRVAKLIGACQFSGGRVRVCAGGGVAFPGKLARHRPRFITIRRRSRLMPAARNDGGRPRRGGARTGRSGQRPRVLSLLSAHHGTHATVRRSDHRPAMTPRVVAAGGGGVTPTASTSRACGATMASHRWPGRQPTARHAPGRHARRIAPPRNASWRPG